MIGRPNPICMGLTYMGIGQLNLIKFWILLLFHIRPYDGSTLQKKLESATRNFRDVLLQAAFEITQANQSLPVVARNHGIDKMTLMLFVKKLKNAAVDELTTLARASFIVTDQTTTLAGSPIMPADQLTPDAAISFLVSQSLKIKCGYVNGRQ
jgi:hypothetical protein